MNKESIDRIGIALSEAAMRIMVELIRPTLAACGKSELDEICAAMRARAADVAGRLVDDVADAPCAADAAFKIAALDLAMAGISCAQNQKRAA